MSRPAALAGTTVFLIAPGTVVGFIPWWITRWRVGPPFFGSAVVPIVGILLIAVGCVVLLDSFLRFALEGGGTPAPLAPTQNLVVRGAYRYVRNPMYLALIAIVFGQALLFGNAALVVYAFIVLIATHLFVVLYEEPTLQKTYGAQYQTYCNNVARWIPFGARLGPR